MRLRWIIVLAVVTLAAPASAGTSGVDRDLRGLADRAARYASPAGLAPLVDEHVAAADVTALADVIANRATNRVTISDSADAGWLAAAFGAAGKRADVERLATEVEAMLKKAPDDPMRDSARCGIAMGFEYLRDHAASDRWRKQATGGYAWCHDRLPVVAATIGQHDRATALLADEKLTTRRARLLIAVAEVYAGTAENARVAPLLDEAAKLVTDGSPTMMDPVINWPKIAACWAAAGNRAKAKAAAAKALAQLDAEARDDDTTLLLLGDNVAEGLAAAGETRSLAKLVTRLEKARAKDDRLVARAQNAAIVAKFGSKKRGKALVAAVAKELDNADDGRNFALRFVLIDSYLALGDIAGAIDQASRTSVTQPIEVEALVKIARHCRVKRCTSTKAVTAAIAAVAALLDRIDAAHK